MSSKTSGFEHSLYIGNYFGAILYGDYFRSTIRVLGKADACLLARVRADPVLLGFAGPLSEGKQKLFQK